MFVCFEDFFGNFEMGVGYSEINDDVDVIGF